MTVRTEYTVTLAACAGRVHVQMRPPNTNRTDVQVHSSPGADCGRGDKVLGIFSTEKIIDLQLYKVSNLVRPKEAYK